MMFAGLFAMLTVTADPAQELGCPDQGAMLKRLSAIGVAPRGSEDVRVRFLRDGDGRLAIIEMPGAAPRRIVQPGPDCASLAQATIAVLSVLLDEREDAPRPPPERSQAEPSVPVFHAEGGVLFSTGIVAPLAAGATLGVGWRPSRWGSVGISGDVWPARDHPVKEGMVTVQAATLALVGCLQPWPSLPVDGCLLAHGGFYALEARGFPVVRSTGRALVGVEPSLHAALPIVLGLALFVRAGLWLPLTRFEVTVRGADSGYSTASLGSKLGVGIELDR